MKNYLFIAVSLFSSFVYGQSVIKKQTTFIIPFSSFSINDSTKYNLNDTAGAWAFIKKVVLTNSNIQKDGELLSFQNDNLESSAIIFLRHGFNSGSYNPSKSKKEIDKLIEVNKDLKKSTNDIHDKLLSLEINDSITNNEDSIVINILNDYGNENATFLGNLSADQRKKPSVKKLIVESLNSVKSNLEADLAKNKKTIEENAGGIEENDEIVNMVLHRENNKFSQYLLSTKKIMIVILGGDKDLQKAEISIKHNKNALKQSLDELAAFVKKAITGGGAKDVQCKVMLINSDEIKPPSDLLIKHSSFKEDIKYVIHEKACAQFKVGVSFEQLDKKYFKIENNQLTVSLDSTGKEEWKTHVTALFDFYPWGRDLDRFDSFWKKGGVPFGQRIGLFAGLQISSDPLQGFYYGLSIALLKNMTINVGGSSLLDENEQTVDIGSFTSLNDAKQLLHRNYQTVFFIGISFAPSDLSKIIFGDETEEKK
jgi:hypothetical protein